MSKRFTTAAALAVAVALPAHAADADELQAIRQQLDQLKATYEARIQALEARLESLQRSAVPTPALPQAPALVAAPPAATAPGAASGVPLPADVATAQSSASAFNPAISLILGGTYANLSRDPARHRLQGFIPSGGEVGPGQRSFSLGESELTFSASIDPTFSGRLIASITGDDRIAVEEAVFERQGLFDGAGLKVGRFLSSIGYLNSQHAHAWDFVDAPLAYQAFFGGQLQTDGVGLNWLAPTERFFELGAEIGAGRGFPGNDTGRNGVGAAALFAHLGDDIGESASWRAGISYLANRAKDRRYGDANAAGAAVTNAFDGRSRTWVADAIYKWAPGGNATRTSLKLQGEYFRRSDRGSLGYDVDGAAPASGAYRALQSGWYLQAVYQFMPQWRAGARFDRLSSGTPSIGLVDAGTLGAADLPILQGARPTRTTLMVDYSLSEFSRFRVQAARDRSNPAGADRQLFIQYIMSLGAHGAHTF